MRDAMVGSTTAAMSTTDQPRRGDGAALDKTEGRKRVRDREHHGEFFHESTLVYF